MAVAERPHVLTLILGLLSPGVAVVALIMSYFSFEISQEALEINRATLHLVQRAYLNVESTQILLARPRDSSIPRNPGQRVVRLRYQFVLDNLGNTPAFIDVNSFSTDFRMPERWQSYGLQATVPSAVGPRAKASVDSGLDLSLAESDFKIFLASTPAKPLRSPILARSHLTFHDMFGKPQHVEWCWTENFGSPYVFPDSCTDPTYKTLH